MGLVGRNKGGSDFIPHPKGLMPGTIVDIIDQGMHEVVFNGEKKPPVNKMGWRVYCGQDKEDGTPMYVTQNRLTVSTSERANARKLVEQGFDRKLGDGEVEAFDYEAELLGKSFFFNMIHKDTKSGTWTNIDAMLPLPPGTRAPGVPENYVREVNREPEKSRDARTAAPKEERVARSRPAAKQGEAPEYEFPYTDHTTDDMPWE
jgi:hypothetical protein